MCREKYLKTSAGKRYLDSLLAASSPSVSKRAE